MSNKYGISLIFIFLVILMEIPMVVTYAKNSSFANLSCVNTPHYIQENSKLPDNSTIYFDVYPPIAEIMIIDSKGRRSGFDPFTQKNYQEIPNAAIFERDTGECVEPPNALYISPANSGKYMLKVMGIKAGKYAVEINACNARSQCTTLYPSYVEIKPGTVHTYEVIYAKDAKVLLKLINSPTKRVQVISNF